MATRKTPAGGAVGSVKASAAPKPGAKPKVAQKPKAVATVKAASKPVAPAAEPTLAKAKAKTVAKPAVKPAPKPAAAKAPKAAAEPRKPTPKAALPVSKEDRFTLVAVAAYYRAQRRGFAPGGEVEDWIEAEAEIDRLLGGG